MSESISVVVLTKDESRNVADNLDATLLQLRPGDEILVIDSASRDSTVEIVETYRKAWPGVVRLHASPVNVSFGAARNLGVGMSRNRIIAFVSADATPEAGWLDGLRRAIAEADIVYGRQRHTPPAPNAATVSRGLRYHHFERPQDVLPERYASNVNAAYRAEVFDALVFDEEAAGAEDVAFAREARLAGMRIAYAPDAVVGHKDVTSWRGEWRKHAREGEARAHLRRLLGAPVGHIAWAVAVASLGAVAALASSPLFLAATLAVFFAPTIRRATTPLARAYPRGALVAGVLASPLFDFVFLSAYVRKRVIP